MAKIKQINSCEILDAKGNPTIETTVTLSDDTAATASIPSGTSIGKYEAVELRDHDPAHYLGNGVRKAIENVEKIIAPKLVGLDGQKQSEIDSVMIELDGTQNKSRIGANAMLSVSMAVAKVAAKSSHLPLYLYLRNFLKKDTTTLHVPAPLFNIINGGLHAGGNLDIQEFIVLFAIAIPFADALHNGAVVYKNLAKLLKTAQLTTLVGDEGGYAPSLQTNEEAFTFLLKAVEASNLRIGYDAFVGIDAASSNFYKDGKYHIKDRPAPLSAADLTQYYADLTKKFSILYLEDGMGEDDWDGWTLLYNKLNASSIVTGDDLTATNPYRLQMALDKKTINGIIIKPNQIGTVIEALAVVEVAKEAGLKIIVSHRSGETNDDFIADFAVAVTADYVKFGAPARGERVAKYNRLLEIERQLKLI
ncbi:MAG TPA: phosphopyruvate hydratase [Patescibacteria group bacterium]|nr:phosphopyruvate hydratase [Patescibacteria group bacterium]